MSTIFGTLSIAYFGGSGGSFFSGAGAVTNDFLTGSSDGSVKDFDIIQIELYRLYTSWGNKDREVNN